MDTSDASSMILSHSLQITQSKWCSQVLPKAGAPSRSSILIPFAALTSLSGVRHFQRTLMFTQGVTHQYWLMGWSGYWIPIDYGMSKVLMMILLYIHPVSLITFHSIPITCFQPFTSDFPRGDIYEMISPDLLHQLIKGTFKDHLVTWICKYLVNKHGKNWAGVILDDIDRQYAFFTIHISNYLSLTSTHQQHCCSAALSRSMPLPSWVPL